MAANTDKIRDDFFFNLKNIVNEITKTDCGEDVAREVINMYGGANIYVNKNLQEMYNAKHEQIYKEFNGKNVKALAQKYNLSEQAIYRSLRIAHSNKQLKLFD